MASFNSDNTSYFDPPILTLNNSPEFPVRANNQAQFFMSNPAQRVANGEVSQTYQYDTSPDQTKFGIKERGQSVNEDYSNNEQSAF